MLNIVVRHFILTFDQLWLLLNVKCLQVNILYFQPDIRFQYLSQQSSKQSCKLHHQRGAIEVECFSCRCFSRFRRRASQPKMLRWAIPTGDEQKISDDKRLTVSSGIRFIPVAALWTPKRGASRKSASSARAWVILKSFSLGVNAWSDLEKLHYASAQVQSKMQVVKLKKIATLEFLYLQQNALIVFNSLLNGSIFRGWNLGRQFFLLRIQSLSKNS